MPSTLSFCQMFCDKLNWFHRHKIHQARCVANPGWILQELSRALSVNLSSEKTRFDERLDRIYFDKNCLLCLFWLKKTNFVAVTLVTASCQNFPFDARWFTLSTRWVAPVFESPVDSCILLLGVRSAGRWFFSEFWPTCMTSLWIAEQDSFWFRKVCVDPLEEPLHMSPGNLSALRHISGLEMTFWNQPSHTTISEPTHSKQRPINWWKSGIKWWVCKVRQMTSAINGISLTSFNMQWLAAMNISSIVIPAM